MARAFRWTALGVVALVVAAGAVSAAPARHGSRPGHGALPARDRLPHGDADDPDGSFQQFFVFPRAYPARTINDTLRARAYNQLLAMRAALGLHHFPPAGWTPDLKVLLSTGLGPCPWVPAGPTDMNGRVTSLAFDPGNSQNLFAGTVGGVWRSRDGGRRWESFSDGILSRVIGAVAVNPGNTSEVFAGCGDPNRIFSRKSGVAGASGGEGLWRRDTSVPNGHWTQEAMPAGVPTLSNQVVFRIRVDPAPPNNVYAATSIGLLFGQRETGSQAIAWSLLGGFTNPCSDVAVDFTHTPRQVYAGAYRDSPAGQAIQQGHGIWKFDGAGWAQANSGIDPRSEAIALGLSASQPDVLYAKVSVTDPDPAKDGACAGIYKTTTGGIPGSSGGNAWQVSGATGNLLNSPAGRQYSWYNNVLEVDPTDATLVYGGGICLFRTTDGGSTWAALSDQHQMNFGQGTLRYKTGLTVHADQHAIAFDPSDSKIVFAGNDGGIDRKTDVPPSDWRWTDRSHGMQITEFYHLATSTGQAPVLAGGAQDNGTDLTYGNRAWYGLREYDGGCVAVDAVNGCILYTTHGGSRISEVVNPMPYGSLHPTPANLDQSPRAPYPPMAPSHTTTRTALAAGCMDPDCTPDAGSILVRTGDGLKWTGVPTDAAPKQFPLGAKIQFIATSAFSMDTIYVGFAPFPGVETTLTPSIWATADGGQTWLTSPQGLPITSVPNLLCPNGVGLDPRVASRAFAAFGGGSGGQGSVLITRDGGANWEPIVGTGANKLPDAPVLAVVVDPVDVQTIYAATSIGVFRGTVKDGPPASASWEPFDDGLPDGVEVNDLCINPTTNILSAGTMGHGAWQRDLSRTGPCAEVALNIRDNVFDRGIAPAPAGIPDPEHPAAGQGSDPFFYPSGALDWESSPDIRIDDPDQSPSDQIHRIDHADNVELEGAPTRTSSSNVPPGIIVDRAPVKGDHVKVYVQVLNRGYKTASKVRVMLLWGPATLTPPQLPGTFWSTTFPAIPQSPSGTHLDPPLGGALDNSTGWELVDPVTPTQVIDAIVPGMPGVAEFDWLVPSTSAENPLLMAITDSEEDPLPASTRSPGVFDVPTLAASDRHVGIRSEVVVSGRKRRVKQKNLGVTSIRNNSPSPQSMEILVSNLGMKLSLIPGVLLPPSKDLKLSGFRMSRARLSPAQAAQARELGLDASVRFDLAGSAGRIGGLMLAPHAECPVALALGPESSRPSRAPQRVQLQATQGKQILGSCTFVFQGSAGLERRKGKK